MTDRLRELPPREVDAVIVLICWTNMVFQSFVDEFFGWKLLILATATSVPLMWRRRYPFAVTWITGAATTVAAFEEYLGHLPAGQLVATYTFAALCPPRKRMIAVAATVICVTGSILIPKDEVLNLGLVGLGFGVAYALGTASRARGDRIAMLEERARRLTEEQDAAATRERERIAREMHDILAHSMSVIVIQAEAGPVAVRDDPDKAEEMFDTISDTAREALAQLRRALGVLRSEEASRRPQPGIDALPGLLDGVRRTGLHITLQQDGEPKQVPQDLAVTAYRIAQEALTNTVKHAAASNARVRLGWQEDELQLEVCDDGVGPSDKPGGHGLVGMRERVTAAGGTLYAGPGPEGVGFRIAATLPIL